MLLSRLSSAYACQVNLPRDVALALPSTTTGQLPVHLMWSAAIGALSGDGLDGLFTGLVGSSLDDSVPDDIASWFQDAMRDVSVVETHERALKKSKKSRWFSSSSSKKAPNGANSGDGDGSGKTLDKDCKGANGSSVTVSYFTQK